MLIHIMYLVLIILGVVTIFHVLFGKYWWEWIKLLFKYIKRPKVVGMRRILFMVKEDIPLHTIIRIDSLFRIKYGYVAAKKYFVGDIWMYHIYDISKYWLVQIWRVFLIRISLFFSRTV